MLFVTFVLEWGHSRSALAQRGGGPLDHMQVRIATIPVDNTTSNISFPFECSLPLLKC